MSIAVDVQGAQVVTPYTQKFGVTFPVAVDTADVFGQAFRLKAIPETFLVDEVGIIRVQGKGPDRALLNQIEAVLKEPVTTVRAELSPLPAARSKADLEKRIADNPSDWPARVALARLCDTEGRFADAILQLEAAAKVQPRETSVPFVWGLVLLRRDQTDAALAKLKQARDLDPDNWRIRKQIWAIEHPEKFYSADSPDYGWQREELAREKNAATK